MNAPYFRLAYASLLYPSPSKRSFCERRFGLWELNPPIGTGCPSSPGQDLLPRSGPQPCLPARPPWWRVPTCPALHAAACQTATRSVDENHTSFECQHPYACPVLTNTLLPRPAGLSNLPGPSVLWAGLVTSDTSPTSALSSPQLCGRDTGSPSMPGPLKPTSQTGPDVQPSHQLRASGALEEDSVCCVEEEEEEEEEAVVTEDRDAALGGPREHALDWDSGFSEVSGSTWREEELPVSQRPAPSAQPLRRQRLSVSGLPMPSRAPVASVPPVHRPRPKSTPDACLEHWQGLEAEDWTAALLNRGRSRQPLVLGDNCFADLVHNWMELPETGSEGGDGGGHRARARPPQFLLGLSEQLRRRLARARRTAMAGKRLSCPPRPEPELPADVSRFAALMSCRSRQPIICNDVSYL